MWCQLTKRLLWRPFRWRTSSSPEESQNVLGGRAKLSPGMVEVIEAPLLPSSFFFWFTITRKAFSSILRRRRDFWPLFFMLPIINYGLVYTCLIFSTIDLQMRIYCIFAIRTSLRNMVECARRRTYPGSLDKFFVTARDDFPYCDFLSTFTCEFRSFVNIV